MKKNIFFLFISAVILTGCAGTPNYYRTRVDLPTEIPVISPPNTASSAEEVKETSLPAGQTLKEENVEDDGRVTPEILAKWRQEHESKPVNSEPVSSMQASAPQAKKEAKTKTSKIRTTEAPGAGVNEARLQRIENRLGLLEDRVDDSDSPGGDFIKFRPGSSELDSTGKAILDKLAAGFAAGNVKGIKIRGNSSRFGSTVKNQSLSEQRANKASEYLKSKNTPSTVVVVGETDRYGTNTNISITFFRK